MRALVWQGGPRVLHGGILVGGVVLSSLDGPLSSKYFASFHFPPHWLDELYGTLFHKIDPSILGGIMVEFDQKLLDASIRTRAVKMEKFLREPGNFEKFVNSANA